MDWDKHMKSIKCITMLLIIMQMLHYPSNIIYEYMNIIGLKIQECGMQWEIVTKKWTEKKKQSNVMREQKDLKTKKE